MPAASDQEVTVDYGYISTGFDGLFSFTDTWAWQASASYSRSDGDYSSLAIAIGYPDLVASINVTINQTGQAIENILIIMAAYLSVSLSISAFMNWYNKRIALTER